MGVSSSNNESEYRRLVAELEETRSKEERNRLIKEIGELHTRNTSKVKKNTKRRRKETIHKPIGNPTMVLPPRDDYSAPRGNYRGSTTTYHNTTSKTKASGKPLLKVIGVLAILAIIGAAVAYSGNTGSLSNIFGTLSNLSNGKVTNVFTTITSNPITQSPQYNISKFTACLNELYNPLTPMRFWSINLTLAQGYLNDCAVNNYRNVAANSSSESYICHLAYRCENYSAETTTSIPQVNSANSTYSGIVPSGSGVLTEPQLYAIFGAGNYSVATINPNIVLTALSEVNRTIAGNLTTATMVNYTNATGSMQEILIPTTEADSLNFYGQLWNQILAEGSNTYVSWLHPDGGFIMRFGGGVEPPLLTNSNAFGRKSNYLFSFTCAGNAVFLHRCWYYAIYRLCG